MESDFIYGSHLLTEDEFIRAMEECCYPNAQFRHADHIRLAWIYLRRYGLRRAEKRVSETIHRFATSLGHEQKYHGTLTRAWVRLVAVAAHATPKITAFDEFISKHAWLLDRSALSAFYSGACLKTDAARHGWVEPDKRPLPCAGAECCFDGAANLR